MERKIVLLISLILLIVIMFLGGYFVGSEHKKNALFIRYYEGVTDGMSGKFKQYYHIGPLTNK